MILVGNQRGGAYDLAKHLMKPENERMVVHDIRGFVADDLRGAFQESYAISQGTKCRQHLFSLSLNPPKDATVDPAAFEDAVDRAEKALGLDGQPRAIVFHEKRGADGEIRRHAHAVWCRIDVEEMKARQLSFSKTKLQSLARELYREHGWTMPRGFVRHQERDPRNYSLSEWQQAKRAGRDPTKLKEMIQDCWMISDCKTSFANALKENGFILAQGDKRGAVAVDHTGEAFPVGRAVGIKAKQVRTRLGDLNALPSREEAHHVASRMVTDRLRELKEDHERQAKESQERLASERRRQEQRHREQRANQAKALELRQQKERSERDARLRKGWRGLLDRFTGKRKRILSENQTAMELSLKRDAEAQSILTERQEQDRRRAERKTAKADQARREAIRELRTDIDDLSPTLIQADKTDARREAFKAKRRATSERSKRRTRSRDGPTGGPSPGR